MFIVISPQNPDPLYKQVTDQVKDAVATGALRAGDRLPSIREMARELNISEITIKRAYMDLENEGLIYTRAGLGSFVCEVSRDGLRHEKLDALRRELRKILAAASRFGITRADIRSLLDETGEE